MSVPTSDPLHKWSDEEVTEELSRNGWIWDHPHATPAERQIALIQEVLRRILQHQIDGVAKQ
jgi:hypothetical protein